MRFIIVILLLLTGCDKIEQLAPVDWNNWHQVDTISAPPADSLQVDTCMDLHLVTSPKFCSWYCNLDLLPSQYRFYYQHGNTRLHIDLDSFLMSYGGESVTYYSGINIAGMWTGYDAPKNIFNGNVFVEGTAFAISFSPYRLDFGGAVKFYEYFDELNAHPSAKLMGFRNTAFTCDEYQQIWDFLLSDCKDLSHLTIDIRFLICPMPDDVKAELIARHATIIE